MYVAKGKSVSEGVALGRIKLYKAPVYEINDNEIEDAASETDRFMTALDKAIHVQMALYDVTLAAAGDESAEIFKVHAMMLEDYVLRDAVIEIITEQKKSAEYAVNEAFNAQAEVFSLMDDPYMQARSEDIHDIKRAVLDVLFGIDQSSFKETEPTILVADELTPSETVKLDKTLLLGIITGGGSPDSHTAILARSMNIPAIIQCKEIDESWDGRIAIIDGYNSCVYVEPTDDMIESYSKKMQEDVEKYNLLKELKGRDSATADGRTIRICANIGGVSDIESVKDNDADGIGLFRTEFIYLESEAYPTEEEQFKAYKYVVESLAPKQVIIRTCDIGADKIAKYMNLEPEENPALGYRGIRICLTRRDFFKTQLRAILRASAYGNLGIMFPMIISLKELEEARQILDECKEEFIREGVKIGEYQVGIMIETPAAVLCAEELAKHCDFFSIGTNDLTQYTLALDRQNANLEPFLDTHHPAVLKAIGMTIEAGHRHNTWVGICGELGSDLSLTETFLRMGVDELSVNPKSVLPVRKVIRGLDLG